MTDDETGRLKAIGDFLKNGVQGRCFAAFKSVPDPFVLTDG